VQTADVVIIGGGVIGLTLALELRRAGLSVTVLDKHQAGREASWAAGGMIANFEAGPHPLFRKLANASAEIFPTYVTVLQDESGINVDLRCDGTIRFIDPDDSEHPSEGTPLSQEALQEIEPYLEYSGPAVLLQQNCLDPRLLIEALLKAALGLGVHIATGADVTHLQIEEGRAVAAVTTKTRYAAKTIVNCAGAWSGQFSPVPIPTLPIKGQMLALIPEKKDLIRHVVYGNGVYVIPRGDGRAVIGSTVEDVGFDKRVSPEVVQRLHQSAAVLFPELGEARIHEDWAGLRPGTPDKFPIMGTTSVEGYFVATGHYRDGILLAPITAQLMSQLILGKQPDIDFSAFSLDRF
jgi:glycine oxidase ThiO